MQSMIDLLVGEPSQVPKAGEQMTTTARRHVPSAASIAKPVSVPLRHDLPEVVVKMRDMEKDGEA